MDPVPLIDRTQILVLNYNGKHWLEACLPSVASAARSSPVPCGVSVVDNGSTDGSLNWLMNTWPDVQIISQPNWGLASFNAVLAERTERAVLLLNNDVKLDAAMVAPLLRTLEARSDALFAAPQCWTFDGLTYEGMRTRVRSRFGLVQGMCRVPGFQRHVDQADLTAAAGPVLMVDRQRFLALGGYDIAYLPGRIEDLDLGFRGWMRGWKGYYVPESRAWHYGFGSFGPALGDHGCERLTVRNTLLFCWRNLAGVRLLQHLSWLPARFAYAILRSRSAFVHGFLDALARWRETLETRRARLVGLDGWVDRQEAFFKQFRW